MRFTFRNICLAMSGLGLCVSPAAAQFCGVSVDCDWTLPNVAHYSLDDGSGSIASDSINGNDGVWNGDFEANVWTSGIIGGASQTNDENGGNGQEHYTIPSLPQLNGQSGLTISLWMNLNVDSNNNSVYNGLFMTRNVTSGNGTGQNWGIALENNNTPRHIDSRLNGVPGPEDDIIIGNATDQWYHVALTWDGTDQGDGMGERALFVDGVELYREDAQIDTITANGAWDIGNDTCCGSREFTGTLDDIAVWNTALNATDVTQIHEAGLIGISAIKLEPPQPGDVDLDSDVDLVDFGLIRDNFFTDAGAVRADGDITSDSAVEWADFRQWKDNFPTPSSATSVPEPTSLLAALTAVGLGLLRRRV